MKDILDQVELEFLDVLSPTFTVQEFLPCFKEILDRDDIIISMTEPMKSPPRRNFPIVLEKTKSAYILWHEYHDTFPKTQRYSLGNRIDKTFIELTEIIAEASFLQKQEKLPYIRAAIRKLDLLKILLLVSWETKSLETKKYIALSLLLDEAGKMLGGWLGQIERQNSLAEAREK